MKSPKIFHTNRGFTLIEILVVVGLFAFLVSIGILVGFDSISRSTVHGERDLAVLMLTGARDRALANVNQHKHGVRIASDKVTIFEKDPTSGTESNLQDTPRNSGITITLTPPGDVIFNQLTAKVPTAVNIHLSDGSKSADIDINVEGRIEW